MLTYYVLAFGVFSVTLLPVVFSQAFKVGTILNLGLETVVETDPAQCLAEDGYLDGRPFLDCCSFVQCNDADGNKTGILKRCFQWAIICAWDNEVKACVPEKWLSPSHDRCNVETDCPTSFEVKALLHEEFPDIESTHEAKHFCPTQKEENTCCEHQNATFAGYLPVVEFDPADNTIYRYNKDKLFQKCPGTDVFNPDMCCCETLYSPVAPCDDLSGFYFENPDDLCCSYLMCFANRTGYTEVKCMPPSVWNDVMKSCDIPQNVMECMGENCGVEMTDPPCEGNLGTCCRAGLWYEVDEQTPNIYYILNSESPFHGQCCPMVGDTQWAFNDDPSVCCCEEPSDN